MQPQGSWPTSSAVYSPKPPVFLEFLISSFFSTYCVLKWCGYIWPWWVYGSTSRSRTGKPKKVGGAIRPIKVAVLGGDFTSLSELGFPLAPESPAPTKAQ